MPFNLADFGIFVEDDENDFFFVSDTQKVGYKRNGGPDDDGEIKITVHPLINPDEEIGSIELSSYNKNGERTLEDIDVNEDFRRKKIGTVLVSLAIRDLGLERIPCSTDSSRHDGRYLQPDGERLICSCIYEGLITREMCYFSGEFYHSNLVKSALDEIYPLPVNQNYHGDAEQNEAIIIDFNFNGIPLPDGQEDNSIFNRLMKLGCSIDLDDLSFTHPSRPGITYQYDENTHVITDQRNMTPYSFEEFNILLSPNQSGLLPPAPPPNFHNSYGS